MQLVQYPSSCFQAVGLQTSTGFVAHVVLELVPVSINNHGEWHAVALVECHEFGQFRYKFGSRRKASCTRTVPMSALWKCVGFERIFIVLFAWKRSQRRNCGFHFVLIIVIAVVVVVVAPSSTVVVWLFGSGSRRIVVVSTVTFRISRSSVGSWVVVLAFAAFQHGFSRRFSGMLRLQ